MFEQSPREGTKASKGSMATSKGSWANALRQPKQASTSNSQSRAPSGSATPVPPTVSAGSDVPSATATATTATTPDAHAHANSVNSVNPANPASQGDYLRLLGAHLELTMNDEQHHTGFLYAFDATMAVVALSSQPAPQHGLTASYAIFKSTEVKQVRVIEGLPPALLPPNKQWMPPSADITRVAHNIDFAVKADQQRATRLGKGVSPLAQQVFDALSKSKSSVSFTSLLYSPTHENNSPSHILGRPVHLGVGRYYGVTTQLRHPVMRLQARCCNPFFFQPADQNAAPSQGPRWRAGQASTASAGTREWQCMIYPSS